MFSVVVRRRRSSVVHPSSVVVVRRPSSGVELPPCQMQIGRPPTHQAGLVILGELGRTGAAIHRSVASYSLTSGMKVLSFIAFLQRSQASLLCNSGFTMAMHRLYTPCKTNKGQNNPKPTQNTNYDYYYILLLLL